MGEDTYRRPSWDEYFLGLMDEVGKRATCDRGRSGCIVVRDKQIVCTGYVGSPPGFPHCDEGGHLMKKVVEEDGTSRMHCVRTIDNKSSHAMSLHPMRMMQLRVKVIRDGKTIQLAAKNFARVIGVNGKGTPPWLAKEIVQDTAVKANEKKVSTYDYALQKGDILEVTIGYYLVNPKMLKSLDLEKSEVATKFHHFKTEKFEIK